MDFDTQRVKNAYDIFKSIRNRLCKLRPNEVVHYPIHNVVVPPGL
jgi:hypothetical protein